MTFLKELAIGLGLTVGFIVFMMIVVLVVCSIVPAILGVFGL